MVHEISKGCIAKRLRDLSRQICSDMGVEILSGVVAGDHEHLLVSIVPQVLVSKLIQKLKGKSSFKLQREFASLRKQYRGQRMWARGYFACSTGNVSLTKTSGYNIPLRSTKETSTAGEIGSKLFRGGVYLFAPAR